MDDQTGQLIENRVAAVGSLTALAYGISLAAGVSDVGALRDPSTAIELGSRLRQAIDHEDFAGTIGAVERLHGDAVDRAALGAFLADEFGLKPRLRPVDPVR